jgi:type I restriction-modification system DNA methylase subunit
MTTNTTHFREFNKLFEQLIYRHNVPNVFDDFLSLSISALALGRAETIYKETIARYQPQEQPMFGKMFAAMVMAYEERSSTDGAWCDILGEFFEEHNGKFGRDARGQFFTPPSVCNFMAQITAAEQEPTKDTVTVNDCACGSGRNLIAHSRVNPRNRLRSFYVGQDVDQRCVKMTAINMAMYGLAGVSIHMNTLTMEIWGGYRVYLPETCLGISPMSKAECISYLLQPKVEPEQEPKQDDLPSKFDDLPVIKEAVRVGNVNVEQFKLF